MIIDNVRFPQGIQRESGLEMYVGGLMGCKGDAYTGEGALSENEAQTFHKWQADLFCEAGADFLYAGIMPALSEAILYIDALTKRNPVCYMTNCVHPSIVYEAFAQSFNANELVCSRFLGIQANTSLLSLAELNGSADLKCSPPGAFAEEML